MSLRDCIIYAVLMLVNIWIWSAISREVIRNMMERQKQKQPCSICGTYHQYMDDHNGGANE